MDLISVIVPVFNVEEYVSRCLESILGQTYENIEIILIDDGSTDSSGKICRKYASAQPKIKVFHKSNGGLSDARNYGIRKAKGSYITFLDSDDVVDKEYVSFLYKLIKSENADISATRYKRFFREEDLKSSHRSDNTEILSNKEGIEKLLYTPEKLPQSSNAKMYRKALFDGIQFPIGKINEDIGTTYKLFYRAKRIAYNPSQYYFYFQREGSIVRSTFSVRTLDAIFFAEEILAFVRRNIPELENAAICYAFSQNIQVLLKLPYKEPKYKEITKDIEKSIKMYRGTVLKDQKVSSKRRLGALCSYSNLYLIKKLARLYKIVINQELI